MILGSKHPFFHWHRSVSNDLHDKERKKLKSGHPESNQGPSDFCRIYSQMLYQLSYSRSCSVIVRLLFPNKNQKKKRKAQNSNLKNVTVMTDASYASSNPLQCTTSQGMGGQSEPGRTRTCNPRLRRPMPYPLGHGAD